MSLLLLLVILFPKTTSAQINPCASDVNKVEINPNKFYFNSPDQLSVDNNNTPVVKDYVVQIFKQSDNSLGQTYTVDRTAVVAVPGFPDCFQAGYTPATNLSSWTKYVARITAESNVTGVATTMSDPSNPFVLARAVVVGAVRAGH
jgi:hypothetical protein